MNRYMKALAACLVAGVVAACGGGGGSPGVTAGSGGTGGTGGGSSSTTNSQGTVALSILNSSGATASNVDDAGGFVARAALTDAAGRVLVNKLVTFSVSDQNVAKLTPTTALTNAQGIAQVSVAPATATAGGAATLTASATIETSTTTAVIKGSLDFGVSTSGVVATTSAINVKIVNAAGAEVTNIDSSGGFQARATVTDSTGKSQAGKLVTFSLPDASVAVLNPTTALTNSQGIAQVGIAPASLNAVGAATVTASASLDSAGGTGTVSVKGSRDFAVSASNVSLSAITLGSSTLPSGGNTSLSVTALINGTPANGALVNVTFAASCGRINSLTRSEAVTTNGSGVAQATYTAVDPDGSLCSGPVTLTASSAGAAPKTTSLTVAAPTPNAVTFVSATPPQIFVSGSGAVEQSLVKFRVLANGTPMQNEPVTFSFSPNGNPGGVSFGSRGNTAPVQATTDANGDVSVSVFSGTIPGPVKIRATLNANAAVFSESQNFTVSSGPPSQRFMSLSVSRFNIEGATRDGTPTTLTVLVADRQGNPVQDGTVINFTAEGGQVAPSCATKVTNGISGCSVDFVSQNPRPVNGRVSVLAFTNGTKDYTDVNFNNQFDPADTLFDIGDAYRDDNEDGVFNNGEFRVPRGGALGCAGSGEPFPAVANTCDQLLATTVRQQAVIMFSSSQATLEVKSKSAGALSVLVGSVDYPLLPMPVGTTVTPTVNAAKDSKCAVTLTAPTTVPNVSPTNDPAADLRTRHDIFLKECGTGDQVLIQVTSPAGLTTIFFVPL